MNFVPKSPDRAVISDALLRVAEPAAIIDATRGALLDLNEAGRRLWGLAPNRGLPAVLDMAMPGLAHLRSLAARAEQSFGEGQVAPTFWTAHGLLCRPCLCQRRAPYRQSAVFLIVWAEALNVARDAVAACAAVQPNHGAVGSSCTIADAASLGRIARQIRDKPQERSGSAGAAATRSVQPTAVFAGTEAVRSADDTHARLAHELKTPLAAVIALAEIMTEEHLGPLPNERYRGYLRDIRDSARHGLALVDGMLSQNEDVDEVRNLVFSEIDLNEIGRSCASAMQPLAEKVGLSLSAALTTHMPRVVADSRCIRQVLLNLLSNCVKYAGHGATVSVRTGFEAGRSAWLEVIDNGPGIPREIAARVLDAHQTARAAVRRPGNQGLGLPLSRQLASANGAELQIENAGGARVRLTFSSDRIIPV